MQENTIHTTVTIHAPAARVWAVLADFPGYAGWNPVLEYLSGTADPGADVLTRAAKGTPAERDFPGTVIEAVPGKLLVTEGGDPAMLHGRHRWELSEVNGYTVLVNSETLTGALADSVLGEHRAALTAEFDAFNEALKTEAERD
ncbi:SRPBCC domain-containing protein [Longispora albida]|uniref:SRPBCC domain-containing protein n=1 Tax=Longispora albida TaxID=203523 RepID=UPI000377E1F6|nr:SRPBCC domain-containing protein [Longispora albida]